MSEQAKLRAVDVYAAYWPLRNAVALSAPLRATSLGPPWNVVHAAIYEELDS